MAVTPLPPMPARSDTPANFITKADAFLAALNKFAIEVDAVGVGITLVATNSTSTTLNTIGLGSKTFEVPVGKSYLTGMTLKIASAASGANWMLGDVTGYSSTTLTVSISSKLGSGAFADWSISQSAPGGAQPGANTDITSLASPELGSATATTQAISDNTTKVATTAYVDRVLPSGTRLVFPQSIVPVGWTQDTTDAANNRLFRVVNTAGGGVGGSHDPTTMNVVPAHTHGFTTNVDDRDHSHTVPDHTHGIHTESSLNGVGNAGWDSARWPINSPSGQGRQTGGSSLGSPQTGGRSTGHYHAGGTDNGSSQVNWSPRYINLIIGVKN